MNCDNWGWMMNGGCAKNVVQLDYKKGTFYMKIKRNNVDLLRYRSHQWGMSAVFMNVEILLFILILTGFSSAVNVCKCTYLERHIKH